MTDETRITVPGIDRPIEGKFVVTIVDTLSSGESSVKKKTFTSYIEAKAFYDNIHPEQNRIKEIRVNLLLDADMN